MCVGRGLCVMLYGVFSLLLVFCVCDVVCYVFVSGFGEVCVFVCTDCVDCVCVCFCLGGADVV